VKHDGLFAEQPQQNVVQNGVQARDDYQREDGGKYQTEYDGDGHRRKERGLAGGFKRQCGEAEYRRQRGKDNRPEPHERGTQNRQPPGRAALS